VRTIFWLRLGLSIVTNSNGHLIVEVLNYSVLPCFKIKNRKVRTIFWLRLGLSIPYKITINFTFSSLSSKKLQIFGKKINFLAQCAGYKVKKQDNYLILNSIIKKMLCSHTVMIHSVLCQKISAINFSRTIYF